jgi:gluconate 2-dehydrogenase subunit 3-like protein
MAFDRTEPPGEATLAETPEAAYSLEFGHTYVSPEEVTEFVILSATQQRTLAAWSERLIPAEGPWPSAAAVEADMYADNCAARSPLLRSMLLRAVDLVDREAREAHGAAFAESEEGQRDEVLRDLESGSDAVLFDLVLELVFEGYYRDPRVLEVVEERTGFKVMAPVEGIEIEPFDESLLERVKGLPPLIREVSA